jgi:hypothetical protein
MPPPSSLATLLLAPTLPTHEHLLRGGGKFRKMNFFRCASRTSRTRRRPAAVDGVPPALQIPPDTKILTARSPAPYSPTTPRRAHSPTAFSGSVPASFPYSCSSFPSSDRSAGQRSPPSHSTYSCALCARLRVLAMYVYVGIAECAPAFPDTLLAHTGFPKSAHYRSYASSSDIFGAWFGFGFGFGMVHTFTSPRHHPLTHYPPRPVVRGGKTIPHKPQLVVSYSTCPPLSSWPLRAQLCNRSCSNKHQQQPSNRDGVRVRRHLAHAGGVLYGMELGSVTLKINNQHTRPAARDFEWGTTNSFVIGTAVINTHYGVSGCVFLTANPSSSLTLRVCHSRR